MDLPSAALCNSILETQKLQPTQATQLHTQTQKLQSTQATHFLGNAVPAALLENDQVACTVILKNQHLTDDHLSMPIQASSS